MAKRRGTIAATEHRIEDFAEDLGKMLGQARNKAEGWLNQRDAIVKNLTQLRNEATKLLTQLGHDASECGGTWRSHPAGSSACAGRRQAPRSASSETSNDVEGRAGRDFQSGTEGTVGKAEGCGEEIAR